MYVHSLPGRIRIRVPGLKDNSVMAGGIYGLKGLPGIHTLSINTLTGSVLIFYDHTMIDQYQIIISIEERRKSDQISLIKLQHAPQWTVENQKKYLILVGIAFGVLVIKQKLFGRSTLSTSKAITDATILLSVVTGYPISDRILDHLQPRTRYRIHLLIRYTSFILLTLEESTGGLFITFAVQLSRLFGLRMLDESRQVIKNLGVLPTKAWTIVEGKEVVIPADRVQICDTVVVHGGETITVDGLVIAGQANVDESRVTGFTEPVFKENGFEVLAGSEVINGTLEIAVESVGSHTFLSKIIQHVKITEEAIHNNYNPGKKAIETISGFSFLLSGLIYVLTRDTNRSLAILLAALPSAASLAIPATIGMAVGEAAKHGIYVKEPTNLFAAGSVNAIAFDKTGTFSANKVTIEDVVVLNTDYQPKDIVRLAMFSERGVSYPVICAIHKKAAEMHIGPIAIPEQMEIIPHFGIGVIFQGKQVQIGNQSFMEREGIAIDSAWTKIMRFRHLSLIPIFVAIDGRLVGILAMREHLKANALTTVGQLRTLGMEQFILITGDTQEGAKTAAAQLGIEEIYGGLNAEQKADKVQSLRNKGYKVLVVGDGVDDGLAMAASDVGLSLGSRRGGDSGARVADIVIASHDPRAIVKTIQFAQRTREVTKQNMNLALGLNVIALGLATAGLLNPMNASTFGSIGTIAVLINSTNRFWRFKKD